MGWRLSSRSCQDRSSLLQLLQSLCARLSAQPPAMQHLSARFCEDWHALLRLPKGTPHAAKGCPGKHESTNKDGVSKDVFDYRGSFRLSFKHAAPPQPCGHHLVRRRGDGECDP